jgi:hypothetical protein
MRNGNPTSDQIIGALGKRNFYIQKTRFQRPFASKNWALVQKGKETVS